MELKTEFVIWGKAPGSKSNDQLAEVMLVSEGAGIKSMDEALQVVRKLETDHGCFDCRIQAFEWGKPDFAAAINL